MSEEHPSPETEPTPFERVIDAFDRINAEDERAVVWRGESVPQDEHYGRQMTRWLAVLEPDASPELRLAARAQHLGRHRMPRASYPTGRAGYLRWRRDCQKLHGELAAEVLEAEGFETSTIDRVKALIAKRRLKSDPETQTLEDTACLVFFEQHLDDFAREHAADEEKLLEILRKTWSKMSERGRAAALELELTDEVLEFVKRAVATES